MSCVNLSVKNQSLTWNILSKKLIEMNHNLGETIEKDSIVIEILCFLHQSYQ
jgi:hypothetical protein